VKEHRGRGGVATLSTPPLDPPLLEENFFGKFGAQQRIKVFGQPYSMRSERL